MWAVLLATVGIIILVFSLLYCFSPPSETPILPTPTSTPSSTISPTPTPTTSPLPSPTPTSTSTPTTPTPEPTLPPSGENFLDYGFEDVTTPLQLTYNSQYGGVPDFYNDIGDGGEDAAVMWVIGSDDNPALNRLPPMGFVQGSKCIWGRLQPNPSWSTENFLMHVHYDLNSMHVKWNQAFRENVASGDELNLFWTFVRKADDATGDIVQYTIPTFVFYRVGNTLRVRSEADTGLTYAGAYTNYPTVTTLQWHTFEVYQTLHSTNGKLTIWMDGSIIFDFTGNTIPTSPTPGTHYTNFMGFEVGMQSWFCNAPSYEFWLDSIVFGD